MSAEIPADPSREDFRDLLDLARSLSVADTHLDAPPDDLWSGIEALVAAGPAREVHAPAPPATVTPLDGRRARARLPYLLGAAAAVVAAVVGLLAFVDRDEGDGGTALDAITLTNDGLDPAGATSVGRATLVEEADGRYALDVDVSKLPPTGDGFLELWIIDTSVSGMYSLGPLHGSGRYVLPDHVQPSSFPIVDVSIEPADGVPQHSGKSILRGKLTI